MTHYSLLMSSTSGGKEASPFEPLPSPGSSFNICIPTGFNALHIQYAVGGGGGATGGIDYDKAGGESSGPAGGSGAYLSDVIFSVIEGNCYASSTGNGGAAGNQTANFKHPRIGSSGTLTKVTGLFQLNPGGGASLTGGGVKGPLASGSGGSAGSISLTGSRITSGSFFNSSNSLITIGNVSELRGGPRGTFNSYGNGSAGGWNGNSTGDNNPIAGTNGATSYGGSVAGGTGGSSAGAGTNGSNGTRGSGGGGGPHAQTRGGLNGGSGGSGEMRYRFLNVF